MKAILIVAVVTLIITACDQGANATRGFRLPEGNADNGKALFVSYGCTACHTVKGVDDQSAPTAITPRKASGACGNHGETQRRHRRGARSIESNPTIPYICASPNARRGITMSCDREPDKEARQPTPSRPLSEALA